MMDNEAHGNGNCPEPGLERDTTYELHSYWRNGLRIDRLEANGQSLFFLQMEVNTPGGPITQRPQVLARDIESAYEAAPAVANMVISEIKEAMTRRKLITPDDKPLGRF